MELTRRELLTSAAALLVEQWAASRALAAMPQLRPRHRGLAQEIQAMDLRLSSSERAKTARPINPQPLRRL
jgi:hypothetical protein